MDYFLYRNDRLFAEDVDLAELGAAHGTPCFVYSRATLERHWRAFDDALAGAGANRGRLVCYAAKANANLAVLDVLARLGSGFDVVSGGELERVLLAGGDPAKVVFSGVGKRAEEMRRALQVGIRCFNVESAEELERLNAVAAQCGKTAPVAVRVNPNVDAETHPYISTGLKENKFGVDIRQAPEMYRRADMLAHIEVAGIDCHIGSQLVGMAPFVDALDRVLALSGELEAAGISIRHLDLGGGLGIRYQKETPPPPAEYARTLASRLGGAKYEILIEPGRAIAGNAGVLLTRVEYIKRSEHKNFAIVDAAMNDLLRPSLYQAWQEVIPVRPRSDEATVVYDLVGPVCESADFMAKDRPLAIRSGDLLAVRSAGAYGFAMSSNYNSRPRAAELMVDGGQAHLVRERETLTHMLAGERLLPNRPTARAIRALP